mgnify:CR=1 FL=1
MSKDFNWKPYYVGAAIIAALSCLFSWKIGLGIVLGSIYFYFNNLLNAKKFPKLDGKGKVIGSLFLIITIQFIAIVVIALISYYIGGLYSFFGAFAGMTIPHFYFIIVEIIKSKK